MKKKTLPWIWKVNKPTYYFFSCRFLSHIDSSILNLVYYDNYDEAYDTVRHAKNWGLIHFNSNYTEALLDRLVQIIFKNKS